MKVFIAGATDEIGHPLIRQLLEAGYDVFGMTRSVHRAHLLTQQGEIAEPLDKAKRELGFQPQSLEWRSVADLPHQTP